MGKNEELLPKNQELVIKNEGLVPAGEGLLTPGREAELADSAQPKHENGMALRSHGYDLRSLTSHRQILPLSTLNPALIPFLLHGRAAYR